MELELEQHQSGHRISSFFGNAAVIGGVPYRTSLIVTPEQVVPDWPPQHLGQLTAADLRMILALTPELILLGTGSSLQFPDSVILKEVIRTGIGIDFMDSSAACRTYNILAAEGRKVATGIIIDTLTSVS